MYVTSSSHKKSIVKGWLFMATSKIKTNLTMLTDFYELTLANGYFAKGYKDTVCYFDMFFRKVPDHGGFAIMAGV